VTYGGDSGNRIFVLYWRCPLITVSIIRGSTVLHTVKGDGNTVYTIRRRKANQIGHILRRNCLVKHVI
jgi:bifunctional N-acetylglucosamine-1-phosphate-uridyltransferase/glucosamine-1-phosphate-acetyltransferase GlmU-like protein